MSDPHQRRPMWAGIVGWLLMATAGVLVVYGVIDGTPASGYSVTGVILANAGLIAFAYHLASEGHR